IIRRVRWVPDDLLHNNPSAGSGIVVDRLVVVAAVVPSVPAIIAAVPATIVHSIAGVLGFGVGGGKGSKPENAECSKSSERLHRLAPTRLRWNDQKP
ncbi:MAG: hypothetical protein M3441_28560, partial [Chloroflexota bacterium]|nr:hypothetical protein [Chloroflexota bacterium]